MPLFTFFRPRYGWRRYRRRSNCGCYLCSLAIILIMIVAATIDPRIYENPQLFTPIIIGVIALSVIVIAITVCATNKRRGYHDDGYDDGPGFRSPFRSRSQPVQPQPAQPSQPVQSTQPVQPQQPAAGIKKYCNYCGAQLTGEGKFCSNCGAEQ